MHYTRNLSNRPAAQAGVANDWRSNFRDFAARQPELLIAGAVLGGVLIGLLANNRRKSVANPAGYATNNRRRSQPAASQQPLPSARLGATEEQMAKPTTPSSQALAAGATGVTGAAYELDPASITAG